MIKEIEDRILNGGELSFDEALSLIEIKEIKDLEDLLNAADRVRQKFRGNTVDLCSIANAKSGSCQEDCAFCAQSAHHKTQAKTYPLISVGEMLNRAKEAFLNKAHRFCIVTSGCNVNDEELRDICKAIKLIKDNSPSLKIDASLGKLTKEKVRALKDAGLDRYNHNIETSPEFFSKICTTHKFDDRLNTIKILKETGIEVCCGGIIGLGETQKQRIEFAFYLKELDVDCVPINFLNPVEGTPLENNIISHPLELLKLIAIFRLVFPKKQIRICGGRQKNLRQFQTLIYFAGADAIILGNYLTTKGSPPEKDLAMISNLGFRI